MSTAKIKPKGRGNHKPAELTFAGDPIPPGCTITIAGHGVGYRGQKVVDGRSVDTGRKAKVKVLTVFKVGKP